MLLKYIHWLKFQGADLIFRDLILTMMTHNIQTELQLWTANVCLLCSHTSPPLGRRTQKPRRSHSGFTISSFLSVLRLIFSGLP